MAAQFTQIATTSQRIPNNFCWHRAAGAAVFLTYYILVSLKFYYNFHGKTPPDLLKAVDLCLEMSSDFKYNFALWLRKFSSLGILQISISVSESSLKHKQMGKKFGSIRGRHATVNALIGNEHYPTMRRLQISIRLSVTKTE